MDKRGFKPQHVKLQPDCLTKNVHWPGGRWVTINCITHRTLCITPGRGRNNVREKRESTLTCTFQAYSHPNGKPKRVGYTLRMKSLYNGKIRRTKIGQWTGNLGIRDQESIIINAIEEMLAAIV